MHTTHGVNLYAGQQGYPPRYAPLSHNMYEGFGDECSEDGSAFTSYSL